MNCIIPGPNIKVLARAIQALAKIGDELFIEAKQEQLTFLTFNQSKTVCGQYHLLDSFFSSYDVKSEQFNDQNSAVSCKIHMKTLLPIFKGQSLEKKLEFIKIEYESPNDVIKFKVKYKCDDIVMSHTLCLLDPEILTIENNAESGSNNICAGSTFYNNLLGLFSSSDDDITLEITKTKVVARNYYVGAPHRPKSVRSQVNLNSSEFSIFSIKDETTINFSLKPFRTSIQFAEAFNLSIGINFDMGGKPLSLIMKNPTFKVMFIVATLNPYADGLSTITTTSIPAKITQINKNGVSHNITDEDLQAIANENWDDFDTETENLRKSPERDKNKANSTKETIKKAENKKKLSETNVQSWLNSKKITSKGPKKFLLGDDMHTTDNSSNLNRNDMKKDKNSNVNQNLDDLDDDCIPRSPESPRSKRAKLIFKRSYDPTYHETMLNDVLLQDSDSE